MKELKRQLESCAVCIITENGLTAIPRVSSSIISICMWPRESHQIRILFTICVRFAFLIHEPIAFRLFRFFLVVAIIDVSLMVIDILLLTSFPFPFLKTFNRILISSRARNLALIKYPDPKKCVDTKQRIMPVDCASLTVALQDATEKSALESKLASKSAEFDEKRKSLVLNFFGNKT